MTSKEKTIGARNIGFRTMSIDATGENPMNGGKNKNKWEERERVLLYEEGRETERKCLNDRSTGEREQ